MGWDGTEVTPQIRTLIEDHHLGSIILTAKNLKCEISKASFSYSTTSRRTPIVLSMASSTLIVGLYT